MKTKIYSFLAALIIFCFAIYNCKPTVTTDCANDSCFYIDTFMANIKKELHDSCMGFAFVIDYKGTRQRSFSDGLMRTARDGGNLAYDLYAKNQIASMSKTITAIATLQLLKKNN